MDYIELKIKKADHKSLTLTRTRDRCIISLTDNGDTSSFTIYADIIPVVSALLAFPNIKPIGNAGDK